MKKLLFCILCTVIAIFFSPILAQEYWGELDDLVSFDGDAIEDGIYTFNSTQEAEEIISEILIEIGLQKNFIVKESNVPNAVAVIRGEERYILYNQTWISQLKDGVNTDWAATGILAHEIAHHLNAHTLTKTGSRPNLELEADIFAGSILAKLGASLDEAQAVYETLGSKGSATHPPRSARLAAVANGWATSCERSAGCSSNNKPLVSPNENNDNKEVDDNTDEVRVVTSSRVAKTPEDLIRLAKEGGEVILEARTYSLTDSLKLNKDVRLIGKGRENTKIEFSGKFFLIEFSGAGLFEMEGIHLDYIGFESADLIRVKNGSGHITNNYFSNGTNALKIEHNAIGNINNNIIENTKRYGINFGDNATGEVRGNLIEGTSGGNGILVDGSATPLLIENTVRYSLGPGILFQDKAAGEVINNTVEYSFHGIKLGDISTPTLIDNTLRNNKFCGLKLTEQTNPNEQSNTFTDNRTGDRCDDR